MDVLFLSQSRTFGGHEAMAVAAAAALSQLGVSVTFRLWSGNQRLHEALTTHNREGATVRVEISSIADWLLNPITAWLRWHAVSVTRAELKKAKFSICVIVQGRIESGVVALLAARSLRLRFVSYIPMAHRLVDMGVTVAPRIRDRANQWLYRAYAAYVTISSGTALQLRTSGVSSRICVVENWIPAPLFRRDKLQARERFGWDAADRVIAVIGRVDFRQKGQDRLIRMLLHAAAAGDYPLLCVVGDGPDLRRLRELATRAGVLPQVQFVAWKSDGLDDIYSAVDAVVIPSQYEGVPLVMLEALARSVPVVGTNIDGMSEWLPREATFEGNDSVGMYASVLFAIQPNAQAVFAAAFERARARTSFTRYGEEWQAALSSISQAEKASFPC